MELTARRLESSLNRLEAIVGMLEREDLELDVALALFEEGIGHVRAAREILRDAELRISRLVVDGAGNAAIEPLDRGDE